MYNIREEDEGKKILYQPPKAVRLQATKSGYCENGSSEYYGCYNGNDDDDD
jgi:hypothetical protein